MNIPLPPKKKKIPKPPVRKENMKTPDEKKEKKKKSRSLDVKRYLTEDELKKLRRFVKDKADLARARGSKRAIIDELMVEIFVNAGLRVSELCNLNFEDLPAYHKKPAIWIKDGKGKVSRAVDIPEKLQKQIEHFVRLYRKGIKPKDPLFVNARGKRVVSFTVYGKIKRLGEQSKVGELFPHKLRHTYGSILYGLEKDLRLVQDQLGHASIKTTEIYTHINNKDKKRQIDDLGDKLDLDK